MSTVKLYKQLHIKSIHYNQETDRIFDKETCRLLIYLHNKFEQNRKELIDQRKVMQRRYDEGLFPDFLKSTDDIKTSMWKIAPLPHDLQKRRVEITGPVNDKKMVINMLNGLDNVHADCAMLDFEDSMRPLFKNIVQGYQNVIDISNNNLQYHDEKKNIDYKINKEDTALMMIRVRGLHLLENAITIDGNPIAGGLLDMAICFSKTYKQLLIQKKTPKFYIPKCEDRHEASWWNKLISSLESYYLLKEGTIRVTLLIETLPAAFEVEEILYELRTHVVALNVGRWDKIFSDIKVMRNHKDKITPNRSNVNMEKYWMDNYAKNLIRICHKRGALAIGGMSAFTPGRSEDERNIQIRKVINDKQNEYNIGHDGCWVSHPYFVQPALDCFKSKNQLHRTLEDFSKNPNLIMDGKGERSIEGLRENLRVAICYLVGWNRGIGCISLDNKMEDLATLEISRAQTWQWNKHKIKLVDGTIVNQSVINNVASEELERILKEMNLKDSQEVKEYQFAKECVLTMVLDKQLKDFLGDYNFSNQKQLPVAA